MSDSHVLSDKIKASLYMVSISKCSHMSFCQNPHLGDSQCVNFHSSGDVILTALQFPRKITGLRVLRCERGYLQKFVEVGLGADDGLKETPGFETKGDIVCR